MSRIKTSRKKKPTVKIIVGIVCAMFLLQILSTLIPMLMVTIQSADLQMENRQIDYAYDTADYQVSIRVTEQNVYEVTERITTDFKEYRHGLLRYIPMYEKFQYQTETGSKKTVLSRTDIYDVQSSTGTPFDTYVEKGNFVIRLGDASRSVIGPQTFEYSYKLDPHDDGVKDFDSVLFNLIPNQWATPIQNASFSISLPKSFDPQNLHFYTGAQGETETDGISYTVEGTEIIGTVTRPLNPYEGVTIQMQVPEGYFSGESKDINYIEMAAWLTIFLLPALAALLWFAFGRDRKIVITPEFSAPEGMTPAEAGYIIDGVTDDEDLISLLLYWADLGYLTIEEEAEGDGLILKRLKPLPADGTKSYEHTMFNRLFQAGDTVHTSSLADQFSSTLSLAKREVVESCSPGAKKKKHGSVLATVSRMAFLLPFFGAFFVSIIGGSYAKAIITGCVFLYMASMLISLFSAFFRQSEDSGAIYTTVSRRLQSLFRWLTPLPVILLLITYCYYLPIPLLVISGISVLIPFLMESLGTRLVDMQYKWSKTKQGFLWVLLAVISLFCCAVVLYTAERWLGTALPMQLAILSWIITSAFTFLMKKRTENGWKLLGKLLGLQQFIRLAEKDRIEQLVYEDPQYFFHILPYAYALGVSDAWSENFDDLTLEAPDWYITATPYTRFHTVLFYQGLSSSLTSTTGHLTSVPYNSGGSGSSFGGGGGFHGGGGGFSGGGHGGGGGRSW